MIIIVLAVVLFFVCIVWGVVEYRKTQYKKFLLENSPALKALRELNKKYSFSDILNFDEGHVYDNEKMYDGISCTDYLIYQLQFKQKDVAKQIRKAEENKRKYAEYVEALGDIHNFGMCGQSGRRHNQKRCIAMEKRLFDRMKLSPILNFSIEITLYLSDMAGRIFQSKEKIFGSDEISAFLVRIANKSREFYRDREIWESICRVERGRVSNKIRFSIYKRDGYRCCICGRSGEFCDLEIDHIKPIAKGGKSTYDNLQTLCHTCNKMKGDTY